MDLNTTSEFLTETRQLVFAWSDYLLFGCLLGVSLLIGFFFALCSRQDSASEYLFGGKHMGYFPVAISMLASMLSGISLLGVPTEVYLHGSQYILAIITNSLTFSITAYVFIPVFTKLQCSSAYEYLEMRFSRKLRSFASIMYIISLMLYIPIVVYVPAIAFAQVTGYNLHVITPVLSIICITYTTMGGVKAVVWTDTIQFFFTIAGMITLLVIGIMSVGGLDEILKVAGEGGRLEVFNFNPSPFERTSFWGLTIGLTCTWLSGVGVGQKFIQRILAIEKEEDYKKSLLCVTIGFCLVNITCVTTGIVMYVKYNDCDPLKAKFVKQSDQILPYYVMDIAGSIPGLPGIFLAGIVSSALSTMSASLNTLSGTIYEDFIDQYIKDGPNKDATSANIMKGISVIIGLITIGLIFIIEHLGTIFEMAISLRSVVEGPLLGVFVLGIMCPTVGKKGAFYGGLVSLVIMVWINVGAKWNVINKRIQYPPLPLSTEGCPHFNNQTEYTTANSTLPTAVHVDDEPFILFQISIMYLVLFGTLIAVVVGYFVSFVTGEFKTTKVKLEYLTPFVQRYYAKKKYIEVPLHDMTIKK